MNQGTVHHLTHPLIQHKLTLMRQKDRSASGFRRLLHEIALLMAYELTRDMPTQAIEIETPLEKTTGLVIDGKKTVLVPILRAGLGLVDGMLEVVPGARVGHVGLYRDPTVAATTAACDWRIVDLVDATRPVSLYLVIPPSDISRTKPLIRLLLNQIGRRLTEELAPDAKRQRVLIMLDEFPALGRLDFFESALAFMAGYGMKAFLIAQSLNQIEHAYGQNNAILDNCHVRVCFATNDERTAKRVSESLGTATELRAMKNYAGHRLSPWLGHLMISKSETARALLTPGEIQELPKTDEIVMMAGAHPIRAKKAQYFRDRRLATRVMSPPEVRATAKEAGARHDWQGLVAKMPAETKRRGTGKHEPESDPGNAGIRTEPELPIHEDIAPPPKPVAKEFDFDRDEQTDDDAVRNRRLQDRMRGNARRASLDPGDGIEL